MLSSRKAAHRRGQGAAHRRHAVVPAAAQEPGQQELRAYPTRTFGRICDTFLAFEETEQSRIFPNEAFGYWKVICRTAPCALEDIDPERAYTAKEIKALRGEWECAPRPRRRSSRRCTARESTGRPPATACSRETIKPVRPVIVEYEPDTDLRDTEQVPLLH